MLRAVNAAGSARRSRSARRRRTSTPTTPSGSRCPPARHAVAFHARQPGGFVVGGTKWDFTSRDRIPERRVRPARRRRGRAVLARGHRRRLDAAARNLLLLGDPQQLPQVTQGRHPEPVDRSALGWLADGHDTLPDELGYFLDRTWRMHPALCAAVSRLSYEDRLTAVPQHRRRARSTASRRACAPSLVDHEGNAVSLAARRPPSSSSRCGTCVGRRWRTRTTGTDRPLTGADVLVVAPYNAQVWTVRRALDDAGLADVRVGTVDKFQGQEAAVVLVTTCASSADEVPRGMEFLLNRNRLNVAVSRAQWCAVDRPLRAA